MVIKTESDLKVADLVWLATALLHREHPQRSDFSKKEILARAAAEDAEVAKKPGVSLHISTHCVASKKASPARHRMLTRTRAGRRRLYRPGDETNHERESGAMTPALEDLPEKYHSLVEWYEKDYSRRQKHVLRNDERSEGATAETMMRLMGRISREDGDEMIRIIDECCGRVDPNEW